MDFVVAKKISELVEDLQFLRNAFDTCNNLLKDASDDNLNHQGINFYFQNGKSYFINAKFYEDIFVQEFARSSRSIIAENIKAVEKRISEFN